jgi:ABC-type multidrug transport system fused ATPase/permease subunit
VIDVAISGNMAVFQKMLMFSIVYIMVLGIISYLYSLSSKILIRNLTKILRKEAFYGILKRNTQDFASVNTADYISAFTNDIKLIEENYIIPSLMVLQYAVMFIVTLILLFQISPLIALCLLGSMIVMFTLPGLMGKSLQVRQEMLSKQFSTFTSKLKDFFSGYEVIKSFQIMKHIKKEFLNENNQVANAKYQADKLFALNEGISGILAYLTQFSGLFIGAYLIIRGNITAGTLVALIQLSGTFVSPVMMILQNIPKIKSIVPVIKRMEELADYSDTSFTGTLEPTLFFHIHFSRQ